MKYLLLLLLFPMLVSAQTIYQDNDFIFHQYEDGWILLTPKYDYFAVWLGKDLGAMWIERKTGFTTCLIINQGIEQECSFREFSILLTKFPYEIIERL